MAEQTRIITDATVIGELDLFLGDGSNVFTIDDLAFISDENIGEFGGGLFILDLSDPEEPSLISQTLLGSSPETSIATDVAVAGTLAFLTIFDGDGLAPFNLADGLAVFDVSAPETPQFLSNVPFETNVVSDIAVNESLNLFVSSNPEAESLAIGTFSDLGTATLDQTVHIPGGASEVTIAPSGLAVVVGDIGEDTATQSSTLTIVEPVSGDILGSVDFTDDIEGSFDPFGVVVTPDGDNAFVSGGFVSTDVAVFDISDPTAPDFVTTVDTAGTQAFGISLVDDQLFVSNPDIGGTPPAFTFDGGFVTIVDIADPTNPEVTEIVDLDPLGAVVDVSATRLDDGDIRAVGVNADFSAIGGTPGGVSIIEATVDETDPVGDDPVSNGLPETVLGTDEGEGLVGDIDFGANDAVLAGGGNDDIDFVSAVAETAPFGEGVAIGGTGNDIINAATENYVFGGAGNDALSAEGFGSRLSGGAGDDVFFAVSGGENLLLGGDGDDTFNIASGGNTATGGAGSDTFVFADDDLGETTIIVDFTIGEDELIFGADANLITADGESIFVDGVEVATLLRVDAAEALGLDGGDGSDDVVVTVDFSASTTFPGPENAVIEDEGTSTTFDFQLSAPAPEGGLRVFVDSDVSFIISRFDLPTFIADPEVENIDPTSFSGSFDNSGFAFTITEGATDASFTIDVFDNEEPEPFAPEAFDGLVATTFALQTEVSSDDELVTGPIDSFVVGASGSTTVIFADTVSDLEGSASSAIASDFLIEGGGDAIVIANFIDGDDLLELAEGLAFSQLSITQGTGDNSDDTLINLTDSGELLAILSGIDASTITAADFV